MATITAIIALLVEYAAIWGPSIVAVLGIVVSVVASLAKVKAAIEEFKQDKTIDNLRDEMTVIEAELKETNRQNALLLDELSRIKGYSATKKKESSGK